jgi:putative ABC transport system ATP-binding protein
LWRAAITGVTHDETIFPTFKRICHLRDGRAYEGAGEGRSLV